MDSEYLSVPLSLIDKLILNDFVRYKKKSNNDKYIYGYVKTHWSKDNVKGLTLSHGVAKTSKSWTISYDYIELIEKKINPKFYFEYYHIMNSIKN